ncbi:hypothetical protein OAK75_06115 [Bacteriovoracales bacterium]|nr:hypothetical protein [Bacteriovoracales bacterium]
MKKETIQILARTILRSSKTLILLFCLFLHSSVYTEEGIHGAADTAAPAASADTLMNSVTKFKMNKESTQKKFEIFDGMSKEERVNALENTAKDLEEKKKAHVKNMDESATAFEKQKQEEFKNTEAATAEKPTNKSKWQKAKSSYRKVEAANEMAQKKTWESEGSECVEAKSALQRGEPPELWKNPFQISTDKLANKRVGHAYSPKFQGAMLFKECQGFSSGEWDILVNAKSSGSETWAGSWHDMAKSIMAKIKPYALTPREWDLAIRQLRRSLSFEEQMIELKRDLVQMGVSPTEVSSLEDENAEMDLDTHEADGDVNPLREAEKNAKLNQYKKLVQMKKEWGSGEAGEGGGGPKSAMEKLQSIKKHFMNVIPKVEEHFAKIRKCAALIHLTSMMDYGQSEYTSASSSGGEEGGGSFNQIQMQMQMSRQFQSGEAQTEQMELAFSCSTSGAETQDYPACRRAISHMNAFRIATEGFNTAMKLKMDIDAKKRMQKVKCQAEYLKNPNMEMTVSTDPENPGCAEYITQKSKTNVELLEQQMNEKKLVLEQRKQELDAELQKEGLTPQNKINIENEKKSIDQEINVLMKSQTERMADHKKRSTNLSVQQLALEAQKEGIESKKKFQFAKMGFQATKLAVLGSSFSKFPDKAKLYGLCKSGLSNLAEIEKENKRIYKEWLEKFLASYRAFKCRPIGFDVLEFVKGNIHGSSGFGEMEGEASASEPEEGGESAAITSKDKATTDDPCQDTIANSSVALLRNSNAREQLKMYLVGVGKDALVSFMQAMIFNNQANVVQAAMDGTKAMEVPFTMTPILTENFNKLCNGTPIAPVKICKDLSALNKKGKIFASEALKIGFQGGAATKIAPRKRLKLGVNRKAGNIKASSGDGGVDSLGSGGDDMGGGGEETASGEPQAMQGLGEVASAEGGGGGEAGGPGLIEGGGDEGGGGDPGQAAIGDEGGSDLQGGELQVAQFQGGGKMAGGGVGSDMGGMVSGGDGGQMNFRGPAGDGGLAGRAKGIFKIISKRYKSINGRNKLLKYEKK